MDLVYPWYLYWYLYLYVFTVLFVQKSFRVAMPIMFPMASFL